MNVKKLAEMFCEDDKDSTVLKTISIYHRKKNCIWIFSSTVGVKLNASQYRTFENLWNNYEDKESLPFVSQGEFVIRKHDIFDDSEFDIEQLFEEDENLKGIEVTDFIYENKIVCFIDGGIAFVKDFYIDVISARENFKTRWTGGERKFYTMKAIGRNHPFRVYHNEELIAIVCPLRADIIEHLFIQKLKTFQKRVIERRS